MEVTEGELFDKKIAYVKILEECKKTFMKKWEDNLPSPDGCIEKLNELAALGAGAFGQVKLCQDKVDKSLYAVKYLLKEHIIKHKQIRNIYSEKRVLSSNNFPFLMSLVFSCKDNDYIYLGMPYISGGDLFTYHRKVKKFKEPHAKFYAAQVCLALEYLHNMNLIYRDLKPENIMIDSSGYIKITDFGYTKRVETRTQTLCGTPEYIAPEIIQTKPYGRSVDWWAFGVLIFELVAGHSPFAKYNKDILLMYAKICECKYKMPMPFSPQLKNLIENLLQVDMTRRYGNLIDGAKDIKQHHWFLGVDWFDVLNKQVEPPYVPMVKNLADTTHFETVPQTIEKRSKINRYAEEFAEF